MRPHPLGSRHCGLRLELGLGLEGGRAGGAPRPLPRSNLLCRRRRCCAGRLFLLLLACVGIVTLHCICGWLSPVVRRVVLDDGSCVRRQLDAAAPSPEVPGNFELACSLAPHLCVCRGCRCLALPEVLVDLLQLVLVAQGVARALALGLGGCVCVLMGLVVVARGLGDRGAACAQLVVLGTGSRWNATMHGARLRLRPCGGQPCGGQVAARASAVRHRGLVPRT